MSEKSISASDAASALLLAYAKNTPVFSAEDAWGLIDTTDVVIAPNHRGPLFKKTLIDPGLVMKIGTSKAKNKQAHGRAVVVWKSMLCKAENEVFTSKALLNGLKAQVHLRKLTLLQALTKAYEAGAGVSSL